VALHEARDEGMERGDRSRQIQAQPMLDARSSSIQINDPALGKMGAKRSVSCCPW
jgi:hypothetical protein